MLEKLKFLYGEEQGKKVVTVIEKLIQEVKLKIKFEDRDLWNEKDVFLITYADSFQEANTPTLLTLKKFLDQHLKGVIEDVHILPFYPYSSDRGFSITDYYQVNKEFGTWGDIEEIAKKYRLMADLVLNHVSVKHDWFQKFLTGDPKYEDYFIWFKEENIPWEDLKKVVRSRSTPLVTPFDTDKGRRFVWTTYSVGNFTDQVDLNYQNPEVLVEIIKIFLNLLEKGVRIFRLDAVSGIWKKLGTTCRNLPQTHTIIKLFRQILDQLCPSALLITEATTSSFNENLRYFGNGEDEAQMVYNFPMAALILQSFYSGNTEHLTTWQTKMSPLNAKNALFNILDIHDGFNTHAACEILSESEFQILFNEVEKRGGKFSYRIDQDGKKIVKEMNITWWSSLNDNDEEPFEIQLRKFITSRAIAMSIKGVPAVYYLSLFGQKNDYAAFEKSKLGRDINRTAFIYSRIRSSLSNPESREARIFNSLLDLIKKKKQLKAFHPNSKQEILSIDSRLFSLVRGEGNEKVLALHNVTNAKIELKYGSKTYHLEPYSYSWEKL